MKKHRAVLMLACITVLFARPATAVAQNNPPVIQWAKSYLGGAGNYGYWGNTMNGNIAQTSEGGYILGGGTSSSKINGYHGSYDALAAKLSNSGNIQWMKCYGGNLEDIAYCIQQTNDGGFIMACWTGSKDGDVNGNIDPSSYWIVKLDNNGTISWAKCYGAPFISYNIATWIQQTNDGGYIVSGFSNGYWNVNVFDYWIIKLDSLGSIIWQHYYGGSNNEFANCIAQTNDGGYIIAGTATSNDGDVGEHHGSINSGDYWIVKIDDVGSIEWKKDIGGSADDEATSIQQTSDGGYIVAGFSFSTDGDVTGHHGGDTTADYWIVKLNDSGNIQWERSLGGSEDDKASSIEQTQDSGYIIAGWSYSQDDDVTGHHYNPLHDNADYWIVKLDKVGNIQWEKCYGGSLDDYAVSIQQTIDGGYIICGTAYSPDGDVTVRSADEYYWVVKLSPPIFLPMINSLGQQTLVALLCNIFECDTLYIHNIGSGTLVISSAPFTIGGANYTLVSPSLPDSIAPGDSLPFIIKFAPTIAGTLAATLNIYSNDTAAGHNPWQVQFTGRKDSVGFMVQGVLNDTLDLGSLSCGVEKDTTCVLVNSSSLPTAFSLSNGVIIHTPIQRTAYLAVAQKDTIPLHFPGGAPGIYRDSLVVTDTCGRQQTVYLKATVDSVLVAISAIPDSTLCANVPLTQRATLRNLSSDTLTLALTSGGGAGFAISPDTLVLAPGDSEAVTITFAGAMNSGTNTATFVYTDDCGGVHVVTLVVNVRQLPPLALTLAPQSGAITINDEAKVYVVASSLAALSAGGNVTFTVNNEPTALAFDSLSSPCGASIVAGNNSVTVTLANCPTLTSDTIATLYYQTLAGSTLSPEVALAGASTTNICDTVSGVGAATLSLLPPGCELGTIIVEPYTTSLGQIYPNPATGTAMITYSTIEDAPVRIVLTDELGRTVQTIVNEYKKHGRYAAPVSIAALPSGVYVVQMNVGRYEAARELVVMK